jgi:osmotically-inducible protein OsmY
MISTKRAASAIAATALVFAVMACADREADTTDTAAGAVGATAGVGATTPSTPTPSTPSAESADDRVEVALSTDANLRGFGLDADESQGRIILKGAVRTEEQKSQAAQVAARVAPGVTVDNRIRVQATARMSTSDPVDVDAIEEQVENALEEDATLRPFDLEVDEDNGQIIITGNVRTADQKALADQIAKRIAGTVVVVNRVRVQ